jgi:hypothetical protein
MQRPIPEYGVEHAPPLRKWLLGIAVVLAGTFAFLISVGIVTFRLLVPSAPGAAPAVPAVPPTTAPAAAAV